MPHSEHASDPRWWTAMPTPAHRTVAIFYINFCVYIWFTLVKQAIYKNSTVLNSPCMVVRFSELPCCKSTVRRKNTALVSSHVLRLRVNCTGMWRRVCQSPCVERARLRNVGRYVPRAISFILDDMQLQQRRCENLTLHTSRFRAQCRNLAARRFR